MLEERLCGPRRYQLPINVRISGADFRLFPEWPASFQSASRRSRYFTASIVSVSTFVGGILDSNEILRFMQTSLFKVVQRKFERLTPPLHGGGQGFESPRLHL
jgi:hypothetical protein